MEQKIRLKGPGSLKVFASLVRHYINCCSSPFLSDLIIRRCNECKTDANLQIITSFPRHHQSQIGGNRFTDWILSFAFTQKKLQLKKQLNYIVFGMN